ncbi:toll-Interleukin receptor [Enhydrobacter aerosaccus]|nr:toll-Interleukin receptor [Enhydrobacter aerosaccus]|tara:strand:+ start:503 stop:1012 length:510 start_codon:yes stop_codon:yes gene_type:complete
MLSEETAAVRETDRFDIFLSHCVADADVILGVKTLLEEAGNNVYVDWIVDSQLERSRVTPATADVLRSRMRQSESLFFATSTSSPDSKWMPWELGYFDGLRQGRIAILPLVATEGAAFLGQEYLGLYPKVERLERRNGRSDVFVTKGAGTQTFMELSAFKSGSSTFRSY